MSRLAVLVGVASLAILIGGCGGEDEQPLTKAAFIKAADSSCEKSYDELRAEGEAYWKSQGLGKKEFPSEAQLQEWAREIYLPGVERRVEAMRDLDPPSQDEDRVEAIYAATEAAIASTEKNIKSFFQGDPFAKPKDLSRDYGFKTCGTA